MKKGTTFRFITTHNLSAKENMAIDKTLIHTFNQYQEPIFRLYTWEKSFTVGIAQNCEEYNILYPQFKHNCAKRMTGGGVLFHGHDISYSLIVPTSYLEGLSVKGSYEVICQFLLNFYNTLGLKSAFAKDIEEIELSKSQFCQVGFEAYDIIVNGLKIGGNAQKRSKKFIFQHGSIPIEPTLKQEVMGHSLTDVNVHLTYDDALQKITKAFESSFEVTLNTSSLNEDENNYMKKILEVQYNDCTKES